MSRHLFTIAPDADFLGTLADRVLDGTLIGDWPRKGPFWLADVTIVLPTRRARFALASAFSARGHGLLPDIRTFGGEPGDEEPFLPPIDAPVPPPAASRIERQLTLSRLIAAWAGTPQGREVLADPPTPAEILHLADLMGELIDDIEIEGAEIGRLDALLAERDLAGNWQQTARLLAIALEFWPRALAERGRIDPAALRNMRLEREASAARLVFGERPVIAAGSTGSIPATARLLAAILDLECGALVLPGFDTALGPADVEALSDADGTPHGHPQYGLVKLLRQLRALPGDVVELAPRPAPRTLIVRQSLALAEATSEWSAARARLAGTLPQAMEGLAVLAAPTEDVEARAIALLAVEALRRDRTVGIVSPDRDLARRIAAELARFGIDVDDAAGTPLFQSPAGRLARQILAVAASDFAAVDLMALLRNRAAQFGLDRGEVARRADRIDLGLLRGTRPLPGLGGLRGLLDENVAGTMPHTPLRLGPADAGAIGGLFDRIGMAFAPLRALLAEDAFSVSAFAQALSGCFDAVVAGAADVLPPGGAEFRTWIADALAGGEGPALSPTGLEDVMAALMRGREVRNPVPRRDDIAIWGQLEARLQNPGVMILAGLNEGVWPEAADPGPWLGRNMRIGIGLDPPERRQGQAAHDFMMALGNGEVVLAYSGRIGTAPTQPSRFLQRLEAFVGADWASKLKARGAAWVDSAVALDAAARRAPAPRPAPCPPAAWRPRRLSVTEIETLARSPYDIYARHVLGLKPIDPLGAEVTGRERGTITHAVFERFVEEGHDVMAENAHAILMRLAIDASEGLAASGEGRDIWRRRFEVAASGFLAFERERQSRVRQRHAEVRGEWIFPELEGFRLTGRADRVDLLNDGTLSILDFKTGAVPPPEQMQTFGAPQLLIEAALARVGAFAPIPAGPPSELSFIKIGNGPEAFIPKPFKVEAGLGLEGAVEEIWQRLRRHVDALLLRDGQPMPARLMPDLNRRYPGAYDHLARVDEWTVSDFGEEP